jgi:hypothetical protein
MLILSNKNKDYYDGVAATTGIDKTIVYNRKTEEIAESNVQMFFSKRIFSWKMFKDGSFIGLPRYKLNDSDKKYLQP